MNCVPKFFASKHGGKKSRLIGVARLTAVAGLMVSLTGCYLTSPIWGENFDERGDTIRFQSWTTDKNKSVAIQCAKATHYGLYTGGGDPEWNVVTNITPTSRPSYDSTTAGVNLYSAGKTAVVPESCWHYDGVYNKWVTAIRAQQGSYAPRGFDAAGLECLGREVGKARSWFGFLNKGCVLTYSNSSNTIPYTRITADS
ncbi:hypothetical protein [Halioxenophilus aromaticivorans]|uniref:Uncharacterized protein n=1 Tax=Halioxenophilus aromaticivorans TaxID=1306992 RepID=A0AAV3U0X7_9ALTE